MDDFLRSRPRARPRSFNALLGVLARLLDWAVSQQLLASSPLRARRRRATSARIPFCSIRSRHYGSLDAAGALADDAHAPHRGATYRTLFALCYGLGLRVGEACGLSLGDVDGERDLLVVRAGKFGKSRLVPHGPRIAALLEEQLERRHRDGAISMPSRRLPSTVRAAFALAPPARPSASSSARLSWWCPTAFAAAAAQPAPQLRGRLSAALVSGRARSRQPAAAALDVHGACRSVLDRRLLDDHPGTALPGQHAIRTIRRARLARTRERQ